MTFPPPTLWNLVGKNIYLIRIFKGSLEVKNVKGLIYETIKNEQIYSYEFK